MQMKHFSRRLGLAGSRDVQRVSRHWIISRTFMQNMHPLYKSRGRTRGGTMNHAYEANKEAGLRVQVRRDCYEEHVPRAKLENSYGGGKRRAPEQDCVWRTEEISARWNESRPSERAYVTSGECIARHLHHWGWETPKVTPRHAGPSRSLSPGSSRETARNLNNSKF